MSCSIPPVQLIDTGWIDQWQDLKDRKFNEYLNWGTLILFCLWNIWLKRNHNTFNNKKEGVNTRDAISQATEFHWLIDKNTNKRGSKSTIQVSWKPPDHNTFKLNVDGSLMARQEYVFREQNRVADNLAKEGVKTEDAGQPILFYDG
ncbi:hypothetical protein RDI58_008146 [Solanum bulbocastanum]|uniref:Uncharacterized protein n=1 Tax=Solanum bulbocastanum TaxID=147425 RepID=A0AAN8U1G2_SOLBU